MPSSRPVADTLTSQTWILEDLGYDGLHLRNRDVPPVGPGQVLVKMKAAALNFRDLKIMKGLYGTMNPALPVVPVSDGAGEVVAIGAEVADFAVGDRVQPVYMHGWYSGPMDPERRGWRAKSADVDGVAQEYAVYDEADILPIPDGLSFEEAACFSCAGTTAWHSLVYFGRIKAGDTVLTMGSGGVSLFGLQIARISGARVIATSSEDEKLDRLRAMGAVHGINYVSEPAWGDAVLRLTGGRGVDHVLEVGGSRTVEQSIRACRPSGSIGIVGNLSGQFASAGLAERQIRMSPIVVGSREMNADLLRAFDMHECRPVIDRVFPFAELKDALCYLESGRHFGKVVLRF